MLRGLKLNLPAYKKKKLLAIIVIAIVIINLNFLFPYISWDYRLSRHVSEKVAGTATIPKLDTDGDGLSDVDENYGYYGTEPYDPDTDKDGLPDGWEAMYGRWNPVTEDWDILDPLDPADALEDYDNDNLTNLGEYLNGTNPTELDTDSDGLPDGWEVRWGMDPLNPEDALQDLDGDGLTCSEEYFYDTDPLSNDTDNDLLLDYDEIYIYRTDPTYWDTDKDGMSDGWELLYKLNPKDPSDAFLDLDSDGLLNFEEYNWETHPRNEDSDSDGMPDGWEVFYTRWDELRGKWSLDPTNPEDVLEDYDDDKLSNLEEYLYGANPNLQDSDSDGLSDFKEVYTYHTNPLKVDTDEDTLSDYDEIILYGTNASNPDSDVDGLTDWEELFVYKTNPLSPDTDNDRLWDGDEIFVYYTDPFNPDTDFDGLGDGDEIFIDWYPATESIEHTDPTNPDTDGDSMPDGWEAHHTKLVFNNETNQWEYNLNPLDPTDGDKDSDEDGWDVNRNGILEDDEKFTNLEEYYTGTDPNCKDSDSDGMSDGWEIYFASWDEKLGDWNLNPLDPTDAWEDPDNDGYYDVKHDYKIELPNLKEYLYGTNPNSNDTDEDSLSDGYEIFYSDYDKDGLRNWWEEKYGLPEDWYEYWDVEQGWSAFTGFIPWNYDTDFDGISDYDEDSDQDGVTNGEEYSNGTDPNDPGSW